MRETFAGCDLRRHVVAVVARQHMHMQVEYILLPPKTTVSELCERKRQHFCQLKQPEKSPD